MAEDFNKEKKGIVYESGERNVLRLKGPHERAAGFIFPSTFFFDLDIS